MTRFKEGFLDFIFGERWQILKLDEHKDYRLRIGKLENTKAVDFIGILDQEELYLIEVKDLRGDRIANKDRLLKGQLAIEIAQKVKDSVACIVGAYRTSSTPQDWEPYLKILANKKKKIRVVLWLEHDLPSHYPSRKKVTSSVRIQIFKQKLTWLTSQVLVCSNSTVGLPDVTVNNLARI